MADESSDESGSGDEGSRKTCDNCTHLENTIKDIRDQNGSLVKEYTALREKHKKSEASLAKSRHACSMIEANNSALVTIAKDVTGDMQTALRVCQSLQTNLEALNSAIRKYDVNDEDEQPLTNAEVTAVQQRAWKLDEGSYETISFKDEHGYEPENMERVERVTKGPHKRRQSFGKDVPGRGTFSFKMQHIDGTQRILDDDDFGVYEYYMGGTNGCEICDLNIVNLRDLSDHLLINHAKVHMESVRGLYEAQYELKYNDLDGVTPANSDKKDSKVPGHNKKRSSEAVSPVKTDAIRAGKRAGVKTARGTGSTEQDVISDNGSFADEHDDNSRDALSDEGGERVITQVDLGSSPENSRNSEVNAEEEVPASKKYKVNLTGILRQSTVTGRIRGVGRGRSTGRGGSSNRGGRSKPGLQVDTKASENEDVRKKKQPISAATIGTSEDESSDSGIPLRVNNSVESSNKAGNRDFQRRSHIADKKSVKRSPQELQRMISAAASGDIPVSKSNDTIEAIHRERKKEQARIRWESSKTTEKAKEKANAVKRKHDGVVGSGSDTVQASTGFERSSGGKHKPSEPTRQSSHVSNETLGSKAKHGENKKSKGSGLDRSRKSTSRDDDSWRSRPRVPKKPKEPSVRFVMVDTDDIHSLSAPDDKVIKIPKDKDLAMKFIYFHGERGCDRTQDYIRWKEYLNEKSKYEAWLDGVSSPEDIDSRYSP